MTVRTQSISTRVLHGLLVLGDGVARTQLPPSCAARHGRRLASSTPQRPSGSGSSKSSLFSPLIFHPAAAIRDGEIPNRVGGDAGERGLWWRRLGKVETVRRLGDFIAQGLGLQGRPSTSSGRTGCSGGTTRLAWRPSTGASAKAREWRWGPGRARGHGCACQRGRGQRARPIARARASHASCTAGRLKKGQQAGCRADPAWQREKRGGRVAGLAGLTWAAVRAEWC